MSDIQTCSVCQANAFRSEARYLAIGTCGELRVLTAGDFYASSLETESAVACGQHHALVLFERYLERGTFAPAEHHNSAVLTTTTHDNATLTH